VYKGSADSGRVKVTIKAGYVLPDPDFPEDATLSSDVGNSTQKGCDQLAVMIEQTEPLGLGRLATDDEDITTTVRTVGRVIMGKDGQGAVALLLTEQKTCGVVTVGGGGSVLVRGSETVPGLIHSDSLGRDDCTAKKVFSSKTVRGIVAEQAEGGVPRLPGVIGARSLSGETGSIAENTADDYPNVVADPNGGPTARGLVTRAPVDARYLEPVRSAFGGARFVFGLTALTAPGAGYKLTGCDPSTDARNETGKLFIDCDRSTGFTASNVKLNASEVVFNGKVKANNLKLPNALKLYVKGDSGTGLDVSGGFEMHNFGVPGPCSDAHSSSRAQLVIFDGQLKQTGSVLTMCHTALLMMGGSETGYLPTTRGLEPTDNAGTGYIQMTGGTQYWTAPDKMGEGSTSSDWREFEDLALWTESGAPNKDQSVGSSGAVMDLTGVFMAPNSAFKITGGAGQQAKNSQYVARTLSVQGSQALLDLKPDPHDVVTIPIIGGFMLVR
jgi:hypothetical protein